MVIFRKQSRLDPTDKPIVAGKKLMRLSVPCSAECVKIIDVLAKKQNTSRAELAHEFVIRGIQELVGKELIFKSALNKDLAEALRDNM